MSSVVYGGANRLSAWQANLFRFSELLIILTLLAVDITWSMHVGFVFRDYGRALALVAFMLSLWCFYAVSGRGRCLSEIGYYAGMWLSFAELGCILSYLVAYMRMPLYDVEFAKLDAVLGFYWPAWFAFIRTHGILNVVLFLGYFSLIPQIIGSIIYFAHAERANRNRELFCMAVVALCLTEVVAGTFPAVGAFYHFKIEMGRATHLPDLFHLLAGTQKSFSAPAMEGIVTFPSYHAAMAVIFMYVHRGQRFLFPAIVVLNFLLLLSTPTFGGHYLVDIVAGALVAALSIFIFRQIKGLDSPIDAWSHKHTTQADCSHPACDISRSNDCTEYVQR